MGLVKGHAYTIVRFILNVAWSLLKTSKNFENKKSLGFKIMDRKIIIKRHGFLE